MNDIYNSGVMNNGGTMRGNNEASRNRTTVHIGRGETDRTSRPGGTWHLGIITILSEELRAVVTVLGLTDDGASGQRFHTGRLDMPGGAAHVVATQSSAPGNLAVAPAVRNLQDRYDPAVIALVGIGGALHDHVALDDVVVATRVVYYESRKVIHRGTLRRGQEFRAPSAITHSVNAFAADGHATLSGRDHAPFRVHHGVIGSGEAVIGRSNDQIRRFLKRYNDKTLAVEMEAGGLAQSCHDTTTRSGAPIGWLVVRGISDRADAAKDDRHHESAARNAARTLRYLVPYIRPQL